RRDVAHGCAAIRHLPTSCHVLHLSRFHSCLFHCLCVETYLLSPSGLASFRRPCQSNMHSGSITSLSLQSRVPLVVSTGTSTRSAADFSPAPGAEGGCETAIAAPGSDTVAETTVVLCSVVEAAASGPLTMWSSAATARYIAMKMLSSAAAAW